MAAGISGLVVPTTAGGAHAWWVFGVVAGIVVSAGSATTTGVLSVAQTRTTDRIEVDTRVALNDILDPLVRDLGRIIAEPRSAQRLPLQQALVKTVLAGSVGLIGPDRVRACWFTLGRDADGHRLLVPADAIGRADTPRTTFVEGTVAGDAALALIDQDVDRFCSNIDVEPPPGWTGTTSSTYRTFVSVPAVCAGVGYGMLTIDALEPGDLVANDKHLLRLMAGLLADGLAR